MWGILTAITGIVCGIMSALLVAVLVPEVQKLRETAANRLSQNNLKLIALAIESYHDVYKAFPRQAIYSADGKPLLSWRVAILGYMGAQILYEQFKLDEPWDSPHNLVLLEFMPSDYKLPDGPKELTPYQGFVGKNAFFRSSFLQSVTRADITDGASNTFMIVEAGRLVPWTKPEDLPYEPDTPLPKLGGHSGFNAVLANGSAIHIDPLAVSEKTLRNAITIDDGQPLGTDWPVR